MCTTVYRLKMRLIISSMYIYIYIYIYMCVCVCVCVCNESELNVEAYDKQSGISNCKCQVSQLTCYKQVGGQILQKHEYQI
jgi:hypothetical protein